MSSLRGKITLGYFLVAAVVVALGVLQMAVLGVIERRIAAGEVVADLLQDSLEMRRYEKKYFLSGDEADLKSALTGVDHAISRVRESRELFARLASREELAQLGDSLKTYRSLLPLYETASRDEHQDISDRVRAAGHAASQTAKMLSRRDRDDLTSTVQRSVTVMIAFYLPVVVLVLVGGRALSARVIWPLRELEARLKPIAEGRYRHLALPTLDREIVSFARAFNGMLAELQARQDQLRHSERLASLGTLVSGVAHELNNPLGNISASTQLLLEGAAGEGSAQCRAWLERIDSETDRARGIVRTLLDYARKGPLRPPRHNECVALEEILMDARTSAAPAAPERVTLDLPLEIVLVADEERLRRAFINLMQNALDAGGPDAGVRVSARPTTWLASPPAAAAWTVGSEALAQAADEPLVRICFDDEGPGIDPEILPRIFDPFFTTHETGHGTGLGLYIVQEIIQEHGGAVAAENRPGGGARFTLWLPTRCAGEGAGEVAVETAAASGLGGAA